MLIRKELFNAHKGTLGLYLLYIPLIPDDVGENASCWRDCCHVKSLSLEAYGEVDVLISRANNNKRLNIWTGNGKRVLV